MEPSGFEGEGRGGALVEEAKKLMQEDEEGGGAAENAGPKIKMNRIGRKGKKQAAGGARDGSRGPTTGGLEEYKP